MSGMEFHPLAAIFPLLEGEEFKALVADIKQNGQRDPIMLHEGKILDGRNRYRACVEAGISPAAEAWDQNGSAQAFVISKNLHRRHLSESQRALIAARLVTTPKTGGGNHRSSTDGIPLVTKEQLANLLNISNDTISNARTVLREATQDEIAAVENGKLAVSTLAVQIRQKMPPEQRAKHDSRSQRAQTHQANSEMWRRLRDGLEYLTSLPLPSEVVVFARHLDKKTKGAAVERKLKPAMEWLTEFEDAWNRRNDKV